MLDHLPIIVVIAPLLGAPLCVLCRDLPYAPRRLALAVSVLVFLCAAVMLQQAAHGFVWRYELGGWPAPWGIAYRVDLFGALIVLLVALVSLIVTLFSERRIVEGFTDAGNYFFALFLLCLAGLLGVAVTNDLFNAFVFLEISALSSYALIGLGRGGYPPLAAYRYLMMGTVGATFFLIGVGYLYMVTGTLNLDDLALRLPETFSHRVVITASAFISVGLAMKIAVFPLHWWLPDTYTFSPSPVSAFLAAVSTKVAIYFLMRLLFSVFGIELVFESVGVHRALLLLSVFAILFGAVMAIYQDSVKRMMAYSSVSQIGYITLGLSLVSVSGVGASLVYLFNHALIKGGLFLAIACIVYRLGDCRIEQFSGLGRRMPWTMAAVTIGGLSLVGVPLTAGFIGKWQLVSAIFETAYWPLALAVLAGSLLAAVYVWRLLEAAYLRPPSADGTAETSSEVPLTLLVPVWILVVLNVYIGLNSEGLVTLAMNAARGIVGIAP